jgi:phosphatidate cytidylyltransferase
VAGADPAIRENEPGGPSNLALRWGSSLVLAPIVVGIAYLGGWPFVLFWTLAACLVLWEWTRLVQRSGASASQTTVGFALWMIAGLVYAGVILLAPVIVRRDPALGFTAIIFLFAVVWATDVFAYFVGRALGGPKLAPTISPKKTWTGALGGTLGAFIAGLLVVKLAGVPLTAALAVLTLALSIVSQAGDLLESAIKRRFDAKDSSHLLPGHGGLMDRLDGFLAAALAAAMVGLLRGGLDAPAHGLLIW